MTRKVDLRQLVELRALRMRRAQEKAQRQLGLHQQAARAAEAARDESLSHEEERRREEDVLYAHLAQGTAGHRDLQRYRGALAAMDHRARQLEEQVRGAEKREREEAKQKQELAAEYRRNQKLHDRILFLAEENRREEARRADVLSEMEDEDIIHPKSKKRGR
ncbi:type III secretion protein [Rhizobium sullae]|uniref:Type III secretion protein n=1 Tax=Rhizobium sullae TaxID=50338 RepID=A0A2N0DCM9_RHISU|nr:YscO family type III secretion system apparatus protein [Rhizobium sullae]PKA43861.1 type III secretion protein [Rhizobium sullae]